MTLWFSCVKTIKYFEVSPSADRYYSELAMQYFEHDISLLCQHHTVVGYERDDLAQELRLELWTRLPKYDPAKGSLRTWSIKAMKDKIRKMQRDSTRHKRQVQYFTSELNDELM